MISGTVSDESNRQPVPFVSVVLKGTDISTSADEKGVFEIHCPADKPAALIFYNIGYETKEVVATPGKEPLVVLLVPKAYLLGEVDVVSKKVQVLQKENHTEFLDFDFYDNLVLALVNKGGSQNHVQIIDPDGKLIAEKKAPVNTEKIVRDCFGNFHLLSRDSSYQVYYNYVDIGYLPGYAIAVYNQMVAPCECRYGDLFYLKYKAYRQLKNLYYIADIKHPQEKKLLATIADSNAIKGFNEDYDIRYFLRERRHGSYTTSVDEIKKNIDLLREQLSLSPGYNALLHPVSSTIFNFGKNIFLIDFTSRYIYRYMCPDSLVKKEHAVYLSDVEPEVIIDADTRSFYFRQEKNAITTLTKYSAIETTTSITISAYPFAKNIKIKSGYIYFLHKDPRGHSPRKIIKYCCSG